MALIRVATINILTDLSRWKARRDLLAQGLGELRPDLVALQEVKLPENPAEWLAKELGMTYVYLVPKMGMEKSSEAIAILSRYPFETQASLDLMGQNRVAQYVLIQTENVPVIFANGHFYWQPGESLTRYRQVERFMEWLDSIPKSPACILCGDFNATPENSAIQMMKKKYNSAFATVHGNEPEYTCPTLLPRNLIPRLRTNFGFYLLNRVKHIDKNWHGTLDYIFVDKSVHVLDCQVVLNQSARDDPTIYPSDHFGLFSIIEVPHG